MQCGFDVATVWVIDLTRCVAHALFGKVACSAYESAKVRSDFASGRAMLLGRPSNCGGSAVHTMLSTPMRLRLFAKILALSQASRDPGAARRRHISTSSSPVATSRRALSR